MPLLGTLMPHPGVIPGPGGPKNGQKTAKMTWRHIEWKNQPRNKLMCHNTPQAMGKGLLSTFMPHPDVNPGPGREVSRLMFSLNMAPSHFGCFFLPFFGPPGPGITPGWGIKVPNIFFPIAWGVLWHNNQFPGLFFSLKMAPCHFGCFFGHFGCFLAILGPPGPGITPGWGIKMSNISFPIAWGVLWHIN